MCPACELCSPRAFHVWLLRPKTSWICFSHRCFPWDEPLEARNARIAQTKHFLKPNSGAELEGMPGSHAGPEQGSSGKGREGCEREEFQGIVFRERSQGGSWRGAQVHQSGRTRDMGLFRGLGIVFKGLSRCITGKRAGKWIWTFIILSNLCLGWAGGFFGVAAVLPGIETILPGLSEHLGGSLQPFPGFSWIRHSWQSSAWSYREQSSVGIKIWDMRMKDKGHHSEFGIIITPGTTQATQP